MVRRGTFERDPLGEILFNIFRSIVLNIKKKKLVLHIKISIWYFSTSVLLVKEWYTVNISKYPSVVIHH